MSETSFGRLGRVGSALQPGSLAFRRGGTDESECLGQDSPTNRGESSLSDAMKRIGRGRRRYGPCEAALDPGGQYAIGFRFRTPNAERFPDSCGPLSSRECRARAGLVFDARRAGADREARERRIAKRTSRTCEELSRPRLDRYGRSRIVAQIRPRQLAVSAPAASRSRAEAPHGFCPEKDKTAPVNA